MPEGKTIENLIGNITKQDRSLLVIDLFAGQGGLIAGFNRVEEWQHFLSRNS